MDTLPPSASNSNSHYVIIPLTRDKFAMVSEQSLCSTAGKASAIVYAPCCIGEKAAKTHSRGHAG